MGEGERFFESPQVATRWVDALPYRDVPAEHDPPRGVIGFFDISQRSKIDKDLLSFTVPYSMLCEMESSVEDSFLNTSVWQKLRDRWS